jgi:hypothetical protein
MRERLRLFFSTNLKWFSMHQNRLKFKISEPAWIQSGHGRLIYVGKCWTNALAIRERLMKANQKRISALEQHYRAAIVSFNGSSRRVSLLAV